MLGRDRLAPSGEVDQGVIAKEIGCFFLKKLAHGDGQPANLDVSGGITRISTKWRRRRALAVTNILVSVALATRYSRLRGLSSAKRLVGISL